jgi:hypothetical protein
MIERNWENCKTFSARHVRYCAKAKNGLSTEDGPLLAIGMITERVANSVLPLTID